MKAVLLGLLLVVQAATAQELGMTLKLDAKGQKPEKVFVSGRTDKAAWLGISFYPYGTQNVLADGSHQVLQVPAGRFEHAFQVADRLTGGGVEVALWEKRVAAAQCAGPCEWCHKNGYHLENQMLYLYGSLAASAGAGKAQTHGK
ncbi:MAG: hypothetical protein Q8O14_07475 [bacterium]|jgi:hypothetical protein|nr:hypothetical protein [bacterium]